MFEDEGGSGAPFGTVTIRIVGSTTPGTMTPGRDPGANGAAVGAIAPLTSPGAFWDLGAGAREDDAEGKRSGAERRAAMV